MFITLVLLVDLALGVRWNSLSPGLLTGALIAPAFGSVTPLGPFAMFLAALGTCVVAVRAMREGGRELAGALGDVLALPPPPNRHTDPEIVRARAALREVQAVLRDTET